MERQHAEYENLIDACTTFPATPAAVAHPCDESSLRGAADAAALGLIAPTLVGPRARIEAIAKQHAIDIAPLPIVDAPHSEASADKAVDGLPMGTRCGRLDPGVILYLMDELKMDTRAIERMIYQFGCERRATTQAGDCIER